MVVLMAAKASRLENQDAIDCAIVSMLDDPKEVSKHHSASYIYLLHCRFFNSYIVCCFSWRKKKARAGITEVHFLPFNPTDKRTALTYLDSDSKMHRVSKGAPEQILNLAFNKSDIANKVHSIIDKFAERGLRSLAVARQVKPFNDILQKLIKQLLEMTTNCVYIYLLGRRKYLRERKKVPVGHGSLSVFSLSLIHRATTVLKLLAKLLILELV